MAEPNIKPALRAEGAPRGAQQDTDSSVGSIWEKVLIYGGFTLLLITIVALLIGNGIQKKEAYDNALNSIEAAAKDKPALWVAHFQQLRGREVAGLELLTQLLGFSLAILGGALVVYGARSAFSLSLDGTQGLGKATLSSTSPGLVLSVLGVAVVITSVAVRSEFNLSLDADGQSASLHVDDKRIATNDSPTDTQNSGTTAESEAAPRPAATPIVNRKRASGRSIASVSPSDEQPATIAELQETIASLEKERSERITAWNTAMQEKVEAENKLEEFQKTLSNLNLGNFDHLAALPAKLQEMQQEADEAKQERDSLAADRARLEAENAQLQATLKANRIPIPKVKETQESKTIPGISDPFATPDKPGEK